MESLRFNRVLVFSWKSSRIGGATAKELIPRGRRSEITPDGTGSKTMPSPTQSFEATRLANATSIRPAHFLAVFGFTVSTMTSSRTV